MAVGTITKLVHISADTEMPNAKLVREHNPNGYGYIRNGDADDIYFDFEAVEGGLFKELAEGDEVEFSLDLTTDGRATRVKPLPK